MGRETRTLYRAVGPPELEQIRASGGRAFPKRVHHDPVFEMTAGEAATKRVIRDWNLQGRVGYVTRFELEAEWCDRHVSGDGGEDGARWVPSESLPELNARIVGEIRVVATLRPPPRTRSRS